MSTGEASRHACCVHKEHIQLEQTCSPSTLALPLGLKVMAVCAGGRMVCEHTISTPLHTRSISLTLCRLWYSFISCSFFEISALSCLTSRRTSFRKTDSSFRRVDSDKAASLLGALCCLGISVCVDSVVIFGTSNLSCLGESRRLPTIS